MLGIEFVMLAKVMGDFVKDNFSQSKNEPLSEEDQVALRNALEGRFCDCCRKYPAVYHLASGERLCKFCHDNGAGGMKLKY